MRTTLTTLGLCLALGLAACSGGDDGEAATEFRAQANAICADYGPKIAVLAPPLEDVDEWAAIGADLADLLEASENELRRLEPPESLSSEFADWLTLRGELTTAMRDVQTAGALADVNGIEAGLQRVDSAIAEADPLAEELGFAECSPTGVTTAA